MLETEAAAKKILKITKKIWNFRKANSRMFRLTIGIIQIDKTTILYYLVYNWKKNSASGGETAINSTSFKQIPHKRIDAAPII